MILLLMSVLTSGQYLLTSTVEEKSNRVVEVLLSAVSAMELMTGKILGQMAVGLLVLALYAGLGIVALVSFAMLGLLDPMLIVFLLIFYVLAYFTIGSLHGGDRRGGQRDARGADADDAGDAGHDDPLDPVAADQPRPELDARDRPVASSRRSATS